MSKFIIEIASVPDRESLVAEIWYSNTMIAEINQENEVIKIEFYQTEENSFELDEFIEILIMARKRLLS